MELLNLAVKSIFIENILLATFLGMCSFLAISKRMDDLKAEGMKERDAVRERWLAVYDTLNPEQKEKARLFFKAGAERMEKMGKKPRDGEGRRGQVPKDGPAPKG